MQSITLIDIALTQSIINYVDVVRILILTHAKVSWFNVPMYVLPVMNELKYFEDFDAEGQRGPHSKHLSYWHKVE